MFRITQDLLDGLLAGSRSVPGNDDRGSATG